MLSIMQRFFSEARVQRLATFWAALLIIGLFTSPVVRVLSSVGMAGLLLTGIGYGVGHKRIAQRAYWPQLFSFGLVYLLHAVTGLLRAGPTDPVLGQDLVLQLPFLVLPLAFLLLPRWPVAYVRLLWLLLIGCCLGSAACSTGYYLLHRAALDRSYLEFQVMPTEPDHIRFSLLVSMAVLAGAVLAVGRALPSRLRLATLVAVGLLFLFQHLLAVRSGLATMYVAGLLGLGCLGWGQKRWKTMLLAAVLAAGIGGACWRLFPTLQNRIGNTFYDVEQMALADAANASSITSRVYSYKVAWVLIKQHPLVGVSKVHLEREMAWQYSWQFPAIQSEHYLLPHNQFIYNLAAYGVLGMVLFLVGFYYCLGMAFRTRNLLLLLLYLVVSISFLVEYTLETQIGIVTGLFFILLAAAPTVPTTAPLRSPGP